MLDYHTYSLVNVTVDMDAMDGTAYVDMTAMDGVASVDAEGVNAT